jgi:3-phenylpropionate/trans-cinnamate dioxygenase ferredoxin subunit
VWTSKIRRSEDPNFDRTKLRGAILRTGVTMSEIRLMRWDLESGRAGRFEADGVAVCVVRISEKFYAVSDRCSHENVSLSEGDRVDEEGCTIECWKHGSTFSLIDGMPECPPADLPVPVYAVTLEGDEVVVRVT